MRLLSLASAVLLLSGCSKSVTQRIQSQLDKGTGVVKLPAGTISLVDELRVPANAHDLEITGEPTTVLRAAREFQGSALISIKDARAIRIHGIQFDGNRSELNRRIDLPPGGMPFHAHFPGNGVLVVNSKDIHIHDSKFRDMVGFAVAASFVKKIKVERVSVDDSGSRNTSNRNNTTGGILFEEGTDDFEVRDSQFRKISGNAVWTHSYHGSPRNYRGTIAGNRFDTIARDAVQVGHANKVRVENNTGRYIGYPHEDVDREGKAVPVGVDSAGKVDESVYANNKFEEINGKCFDLDGFHDGEVAGNTCLNRGQPDDYPNGNFAIVMNNTYPEMESQAITIRDNVIDGLKFGAIFVVGKNHRIVNNKLRNVNRSRCNEGTAKYQCMWQGLEPNLMQSAIFLGSRAERISPSEGVLIEGNEIRGHKMAERCVMTSTIVTASKSTIRNNTCVSEDPK
jgi:hypothetical protein